MVAAAIHNQVGAEFARLVFERRAGLRGKKKNTRGEQGQSDDGVKIAVARGHGEKNQPGTPENSEETEENR